MHLILQRLITASFYRKTIINNFCKLNYKKIQKNSQSISFKFYADELRHKQSSLDAYNYYLYYINVKKLNQNLVKVQKETNFAHACRILYRFIVKNKIQQNIVQNFLGKKGQNIIKLNINNFSNNQEIRDVLHFIKNLIHSSQLQSYIKQLFKNQQLVQKLKQMLSILIKNSENNQKKNQSIQTPFGLQSILNQDQDNISLDQLQTLQKNRKQIQFRNWIRFASFSKMLDSNKQYLSILKQHIIPYLKQKNNVIKAFSVIDLFNTIDFCYQHIQRNFNPNQQVYEQMIQQTINAYQLILKYVLQYSTKINFFNQIFGILDLIDQSQKIQILKVILHMESNQLFKKHKKNSNGLQIFNKVLQKFILTLNNISGNDIILLLELFFKQKIIKSQCIVHKNKAIQIQHQFRKKSQLFFSLIYKNILENAIFQEQNKSKSTIIKVYYTSINPVFIIKIFTILPVQNYSLIDNLVKKQLKQEKWKNKVIGIYKNYFSSAPQTTSNEYQTNKKKNIFYKSAQKQEELNSQKWSYFQIKQLRYEFQQKFKIKQ